MAATNPYAGNNQSIALSKGLIDIDAEKDNTNELSHVATSIYCGGTAGNVNIVTEDGTEITIGILQGGYLSGVVVKQVKATGTTATGLVGFM